MKRFLIALSILSILLIAGCLNYTFGQQTRFGKSGTIGRGVYSCPTYTGHDPFFAKKVKIRGSKSVREIRKIERKRDKSPYWYKTRAQMIAEKILPWNWGDRNRRRNVCRR